MENQEILNKLKEIVVSVVKHDHFEMTPELKAQDVDGWDSISHITIITKVENEFKIKFKLREITKLKNIGDMVQLISDKI